MTEGEADQPYGPHTRAVRRFLQHLAAQPAKDCAAAAHAYQTLLRQPAMIVADRRLGEAIEENGLERSRDAVVGPLVILARSHAERLRTRADAGAPPDDAAVTAVADEMAEAALAAALALVARHVLASDSFEILYRPFAPIIPLTALER